MKKVFFRFVLLLSMLLMFVTYSCEKKAEDSGAINKAQKDLELDKIPAVVMNTLKSKFPEAEIHKWSKEKEGDIVLYDIEFKQQDQKFEADIKEDGTIHNWEKEIMEMDLPEAVKKTVQAKFTDSSMKEIMEITLVDNGQDVLEGYEIILEKADKKDIEITVAPDGVILEDSGDTD